MKKIYLSLIAGVFAAIVSSCGGQKSNGVELTGAGATFPLPLTLTEQQATIKYHTVVSAVAAVSVTLKTVSLISPVATLSFQTRK